MNPQINSPDPSSLPIPISAHGVAGSEDSNLRQHFSASPQPTSADTSVQQPLSQGLNASTPSVANDADLIEKEWVTKAKSIVSRTKDDPSEQSKEINQFKADYIKKRYNKDIKVSET